MIPDFKTFIKESVWNDMRKRSLGTSVKAEDDVDVMDIDNFYLYLRDNYSSTNKGVRIHMDKFINIVTINIPIAHLYALWQWFSLNYDIKNEEYQKAKIQQIVFNDFPNLRTELEKKYDIINDPDVPSRKIPDSLHEPFMIVPKEGSLKHSDIIYIIDTFIKCVDKPLLKKNS